MAIPHKFQLSRLREIGWSAWDPIGLAGLDPEWPQDEYDNYLLQAAGQIWHGRSDEDVANYLVQIETKHMGLSPIQGRHSRASKVVKAIRTYVETFRT